MIKHINNCVYNTESPRAKIIGVHTNGHSPTSVKHCVETLYKNQARKYFLYVKGMIDSKYDKWKTSKYKKYEREDIFAFTLEEAESWAKENLTSEEYNSEFASADNDGYRKIIGLTLSPKTLSLLEKESSKQGRSISLIVDDLVLNAYGDK